MNFLRQHEMQTTPHLTEIRLFPPEFLSFEESNVQNNQFFPKNSSFLSTLSIENLLSQSQFKLVILNPRSHLWEVAARKLSNSCALLIYKCLLIKEP